MMRKRLAWLVSRVFDPTWLVPLMIGLAAFWSLVNGLRWRFVLLLVLIDGFVPFLYFVHLLRSGEISDWDTTKRSQRYRLYWFTVAVHAVGVVMALVLGKIALAKILFSFWLVAVLYALVTFRWKISVHAGVASAGVGFATYLFGWQWAGLFLLVGLIAWSRVELGKHSWSQVLAGALLAPALLLGLLLALGVSRGEARAPAELNQPIFDRVETRSGRR